MFKVVEARETGYDVIVLSCSYAPPLSKLDSIGEEIASIGLHEGRGLFDTLLSNGDHSDRFIEAEYKDNNFVLNTFRIIDVPKKSEIRRQCSNILKASDIDLTKSLLSSVQVRIIKKGMPL